MKEGEEQSRRKSMASILQTAEACRHREIDGSAAARFGGRCRAVRAALLPGNGLKPRGPWVLLVTTVRVIAIQRTFPASGHSHPADIPRDNLEAPR